MLEFSQIIDIIKYVLINASFFFDSLRFCARCKAGGGASYSVGRHGWFDIRKNEMIGVVRRRVYIYNLSRNTVIPLAIIAKNTEEPLRGDVVMFPRENSFSRFLAFFFCCIVKNVSWALLTMIRIDIILLAYTYDTTAIDIVCVCLFVLALKF